MRAKDVLQGKGHDVITISPDATLGEAISLLAEKNIGAVLVSAGGGAIDGILSERDVVRVLNGAPTGHRETKVSEVMTQKVITCGPDATIDELLGQMTERRVRHMPIVDGGRLVGLLSIGDVVKHRIKEAVGEAEALKSYISTG
ncbi:CBS domain-containing protein [Parvularcula marina]|uniref:CBS domain-containing protein n=1 Tax=Parvularcula marina TaxID=2292771 RepID=A0A371RGD6_9PROT|nr:CBS domain-containing protein [Parvularcula marina]RFB04510.1 CBS domain-containing protein [Parvularcula marina]